MSRSEYIYTLRRSDEAEEHQGLQHRPSAEQIHGSPERKETRTELSHLASLCCLPLRFHPDSSDSLH